MKSPARGLSRHKTAGKGTMSDSEVELQDQTPPTNQLVTRSSPSKVEVKVKAAPGTLKCVASNSKQSTKSLKALKCPWLSKFYVSAKELHEEYGLGLEGKLPKELSDKDIPDEEWLSIFKCLHKKNTKLFLNHMRDEFVVECRILYLKVYQAIPSNGELLAKFARGFVYKRCPVVASDPIGHRIVWARFGGSVLENCKMQKGGLERKINKFRIDYGLTGVIQIEASICDGALSSIPTMELDQLNKELEVLKTSPDSDPREVDHKEVEVMDITEMLSRAGATIDSRRLKEDLDSLQLTKAEEEGVHVSLEEWEFSRGCSDKYKSYSAAWSRGRHFRVDHIDKKRVTFDSGVMAKFEQASRRRATDQNIVIVEMQYFGLLKEIINADYRSFTILIFDVQWFKVIMEGPNATVQRDVSGFIEVYSTKPWSDLRDTFVLLEHCEQVIFYPKPSDERWWYVIEVAPRGARIYENYNLITVADAEPIETEVAELPDIDMTMPEDDVEPIEIEVAEMPKDDIVDLNDIDFSLGGELTVDLEVGIELCQDAVENT
ncbi:hypothetical protein L7F22_011602 [Adiantum nelumboides]|nr:hypothetical protein [Adiantum nelumboides]